MSSPAIIAIRKAISASFTKSGGNGGQEHAGIILIPQSQISNRLRRWEVRDRLLDFLNQHTADELRNQLWWLPQE
jgi:hypothetical protein